MHITTGSIRTTKRAAISALIVAASMLATAPAAAGNERMQLHCDTGTLSGHTLERSNGSNWWDAATGAVYATKSMVVRSGDDVVYEKSYGEMSGTVHTCTGDHSEFTWDLELMAAGR